MEINGSQLPASANSERVRCFAACFVDTDSAGMLLGPMPRIGGMRAVPPHKLHVTLRFFGALTSTEVSQALELVNGLPMRVPRTVDVTGLTGFPSPRRATTLVVTLEDDTQLLRWHSDLVAGLADTEERYRPHVTVARSRRGIDVSAVAILPLDLARRRILLGPPALYASEADPAGTRYRCIE